MSSEQRASSRVRPRRKWCPGVIAAVRLCLHIGMWIRQFRLRPISPFLCHCHRKRRRTSPGLEAGEQKCPWTDRRHRFPCYTPPRYAPNPNLATNQLPHSQNPTTQNQHIMTWGPLKNAVEWISCDTGRTELVLPVVSRPHGYKTCLYYSSWSVYKNHPPQDINLRYVTNIFYAFFNILPSGDVVVGDAWADTEKPFPTLTPEKYGQVHFKGLLARFFEIKNENRHIKVSMSIGGWSNRDRFSECMRDPAKITRLVESSVKMMMEYGFDGIDLDWEYPEDKAEAGLYLRLIARIRTQMRFIEENNKLQTDTFLLSMACPAFQDKLETFPLEEMNKYLDFWNMMTYDFAGQGWSERTGYHCSLFKKHGVDDLCAADAINYMLQRGVPSHKLILGMANYGRSFAHSKGYGRAFHNPVDPLSDDGIFNYNKLPLPGSREIYDEDAVIAYCHSPTTKTFVSYDNVDSVTRKSLYVKEKNLGGGMFWESLGDRNRQLHHSLLLSFVRGLGGIQVLEKTSNNLKGYGKSKYLSEQFKKHMPFASAVNDEADKEYYDDNEL